jgi:hypothetical protein
MDRNGSLFALSSPWFSFPRDDNAGRGDLQANSDTSTASYQRKAEGNVHFCAACLRRVAATCMSPGSSTARHRSQPQQVIAATYAGQDVGERAGLTAEDSIVARAGRDRGLTCGPRVDPG